MRKIIDTDNGLLILRTGIGLLMLPHGWQKIERFSQYAERLPGFAVALSVFAEIGCSLALLVGFKTWQTNLRQAHCVAMASTGVMGGVRTDYQLQQTILALQAYPQP